MKKSAQRPWYRFPFVWLLLVPPVAAVLMGATTIYLATSSFDGMVVDDYYQRGKAINQVLHRDQAAQRHGLSAKLQIDTNSNSVRLRLHARENLALPDAIVLKLFHATRSSADLALPLTRQADGAYYGALPPLVAGRWDAVLEAEDWRLIGSYHAPGAEELLLGAKEQ